MQLAIQYFLPLLTPDGIFVIEDVQRIAWIKALRSVTPPADRKFVNVYDLRATKARADDIMYVIYRA
jgi:hypothetical protein